MCCNWRSDAKVDSTACVRFLYRLMWTKSSPVLVWASRGRVCFGDRHIGEPQVQSAAQKLPVHTDSKWWTRSPRPRQNQLGDAALAHFATAKDSFAVEVHGDR